MSKAGNEPGLDGVRAEGHHDRNSGRCLLGRSRGCAALSHEHIDGKPDESCRKLSVLLNPSSEGSPFQRNVLSLGITEVVKPPEEGYIVYVARVSRQREYADP